MMNKTEEFLFEEYKQAYEMDRYLETSYSRIFRTYATALVWIFALLGLLYKDEIVNLGIANFLRTSQNRFFIISVLLILLVFGITSLRNIVKTRKITLPYTSKINYVRRLFICSKPQYNEYLESPILNQLNKTDIGARPGWSWDSEMFFFLLILSIINGFIFAIILLAIIENFAINVFSFLGLIIVFTIIQIFLSWRNVKKYWRKCKERQAEYEESPQKYRKIVKKEKSKKGEFMCWKKISNNAGGIIAIFTIILGIATLFYAGCTIFMIIDQRRNAELEYRPFLGFSIIQPSRETSNRFSFTMQIQNFGRTPANDVFLSIECPNEITIRKITIEGDTIIYERNDEIPILYGKPTIFPKQPINIENFNLDLPTSFLEDKTKDDRVTLIIRYRGIKPKNSIDFYETSVSFVYSLNYNSLVQKEGNSK